MSDIRERFWTWWFDGIPQPVADRLFDRVVNQATRDQIDALVCQVRELTRQRDDARDLAVRSGIFETDTP